MNKAKKKNKRRPTERQKLAIKHMAENGGNASKAMLAAGYSPITSKTPGKLTNSKTFADLAEKFLPDKLLLKIHKEGLGAVKMEHKIVGRDSEGKPEYDFVEIPDYSVRHKYVESAYKIKGKIKPEVVVPMQFNISQDREKYA